MKNQPATNSEALQQVTAMLAAPAAKRKKTRAATGVTKTANNVCVNGLGNVRLCDNMHPQRGLPTLNGEAALMFTSPPYWNYMDYGSENETGKEATYEEYVKTLEKVLRATYQALIPGGKAVINVSNMKSRAAEGNGSFIYPIVADTIKSATQAGFVFFDEIVWVKSSKNRTDAMNGRPLFGSYPYPPTPKIMDSIFENIMVFVKPGKRKMPTNKTESRIPKDQWWEFTSGVWRIQTNRNKGGHPATFPLELAERVVRLYSFVDELVIDPWAGTGTTIAAAAKHGRRGLGFEINAKYADAVDGWNEGVE